MSYSSHLSYLSYLYYLSYLPDLSYSSNLSYLFYFNFQDYKKDVGTNKLINEGDKVKTLMARWRYNSLSIHGVQVMRYIRLG